MKKLILATFLFLSGFGTAYASTINTIPVARLNQGLVGYWSFDGNTIANGTIRDLSGNGNTGYPTNIATSTFYTVGKIGQGGNFDGVNDYVNIGSFQSLNGTHAFTISQWIYANSLPFNLFRGIISIGSGASSIRVPWIFGNSGANTLSMQFTTTVGGTLDCNAISPSLTAKKWNHVVAIWNGTTCTIYVNAVSGTPDATSGNTLSNTDGINYLGFLTGYSYWNGSLDDVRIYNRALSPAEVNALYKMGQATINKVPTVRLNKGLVGYWPFDGNTIANGAIRDLSGNGNTGYTVNISTSTFYAVGKIGQGGNFDGVDDYINAGNQSGYDVSATDHSFVAWFRAPRLPIDSGARIIERFTGGSPGNGYYIGMSDTTGRLTYEERADGGNGLLISPSANYADNKWHSLVITVSLSARTAYLYIDGVFNSSDTYLGNLINYNSALNVGGRSTTSSWYGILDDVRIYNRALNPAEIKSLYNMGMGNKVGVAPQVQPSAGTGLSKGLVGYWSFDGNTIVNGAIRDLSGNGNTGYPANIATSTFYYIGKIGQGLKFDGVNDYVDAGNSSIINSTVGTGSLSVSLWAKTKQFPSTISADFVWHYNPGFLVRLQPSGIATFFITDGTISKQINSTQIVNDNKWHHIVSIRDKNAGVLRLYIDGRANTPVADTTGDLTVSKNLYFAKVFNGVYYEGQMDDVRIYNRALSLAEVYQLYNMGR